MTFLKNPEGSLLSAVDSCREVIGAYFGKSPRDLGLEEKDNKTVLTLADTKIQGNLISLLSESLPQHLSGGLAFLAEEKRGAYGDRDAKNVVIIDPVDGTKNFSTAKVEFAIAAALATRHQNKLAVRTSVTLAPMQNFCVLSTPQGTFSSFLDTAYADTKKRLTQENPNWAI